MIENLIIGAARDLIAHGWIQPDITRARLFYHPEFGTHDLFRACYIQCSVEKIRRRRKLIAIVGGVLFFAACILAGALL